MTAIRQLAAGVWTRHLPRKLTYWVDIHRRMPIWNKTGAIFIHIPKTAGVSISQALYGRPLGHFTAAEIRALYPEKFAQLLTFAVVRHPVDRARSAYRFAREGNTTEMGIRRPHIYQRPEFSSFDRFVNEWLSLRDVNLLDGVFRPQFTYCYEGDDVLVDHILKFESLAADIGIIADALDRNLPLTHKNASNRANQTPAADSTLAILRNLYRRDFELFDYSEYSGATS